MEVAMGCVPFQFGLRLHLQAPILIPLTVLQVSSSLLTLMYEDEADFTLTFRALSKIPSAGQSLARGPLCASLVGLTSGRASTVAL